MNRGQVENDSTVSGRLEEHFDATFCAELALKEKQIQQSYRPIIGIHKWFARRPGTLFRSLILSEFSVGERLKEAYWHAHDFKGVIGDPFMGGGTPLFEANRLGFQVVGCDINPMAYWIVRQSLSSLDLAALRKEAEKVLEDVDEQIGANYQTKCLTCGGSAEVKYFLWVKTATCPKCESRVDLFPGYRLAENVRHPKHVLVCGICGALNEYNSVPTVAEPHSCAKCGKDVTIEGNVRRQKATCRRCDTEFPFAKSCAHPPQHRLWALEYHCPACYADHEGRQFKTPEPQDIGRVRLAEKMLEALGHELNLPDDEIPDGDESARLHRWGYRKYREMFNERQLVGLGLLRKRILAVKDRKIRWALLTVFSDTLRYQNLLCRYDTYALKCQDIFSVHGFPVGLIQCENNLLGIERIGSGSFRHFVEKFIRAKEYCENPFEIRHNGTGKEVVPVLGESICAEIVDRWPSAKGRQKQALLLNEPSQNAPLRRHSLDGVFTDPPYFDNVQYAELMDFCYVWLRPALAKETRLDSFDNASTRSEHELTGNITLGRGIEHFSQGISEVFCHFANALKPNAPFVFTYHHNDPFAYLPLVVGILDAGLVCSATLPGVGEMSASLHIAGTASSVLDSVFVCRCRSAEEDSLFLRKANSPKDECADLLIRNESEMRAAGVPITKGDLRCLLAGHIARLTVNALSLEWCRDLPIANRLASAKRTMQEIMDAVDPNSLVEGMTTESQESSSVKSRKVS